MTFLLSILERAHSLISTFSSNPNVEVVAIADLDPSRLPWGLETAVKNQNRKVRSESDFRRLIDDDSIDALVIGTPDHWHAIPTILACQAGKDVYVEKPDSHNIVEGMTMVAAMKKHNRIVQMGSQHRSTERLQSAIEFVETGALGRCVVEAAKCWLNSTSTRVRGERFASRCCTIRDRRFPNCAVTMPTGLFATPFACRQPGKDRPTSVAGRVKPYGCVLRFATASCTHFSFSDAYDCGML